MNTYTIHVDKHWDKTTPIPEILDNINKTLCHLAQTTGIMTDGSLITFWFHAEVFKMMKERKIHSGISSTVLDYIQHNNVGRIANITVSFEESKI